jgi:ABC-type Fe3+-hydroxamate transport system substrate-binding protein
LRVSGQRRVPTLILRDAGMGAVGRETFIDDILAIAGGENVLSARGWPTLDAEQLRACNAEVVIQLLPDASPQILEQAGHIRRSGAEIPAVRSGRVFVLTEWYAQQSGIHVGELAEKFAAIVHPEQRMPLTLPSPQSTGERASALSHRSPRTANERVNTGGRP